VLVNCIIGAGGVEMETGLYSREEFGAWVVRQSNCLGNAGVVFIYVVRRKVKVPGCGPSFRIIKPPTGIGKLWSFKKRIATAMKQAQQEADRLNLMEAQVFIQIKKLREAQSKKEVADG